MSLLDPTTWTVGGQPVGGYVFGGTNYAVNEPLVEPIKEGYENIEENVSDAVKGPDLPPTPDFTGAAEATSEGDLAMQREALAANRVNQTTPWGSSTWTAPTEEGGQWSQTTKLSPQQQALLESQQGTDLMMGEMGQQGLEQVGDLFSSRFKTGYDPIGTYGDKRKGIMDAMMSRVGTDIARDRESKSGQLIASGIPKGSEAYNREMEMLDRKHTDARQQAEIAATQQTGQMLDQDIKQRRQGISELLAERQTPLNELNAFRTGTQVSSPQFAQTPQMQAPSGPDYLGATMAGSNYDLAGYNAGVAGSNQLMGGLFGLGAAGIMAPAVSDIRLKRDIKRVGSTLSGIPTYTFKYLWDNITHYGVMAQEVLKSIPEAVIVMDNGYYAVDYGKIK
jgi:hypothetical protein